MTKFFTLFALALFSASLFAQSTVEVVTGQYYANENYYSFTLDKINTSPRNNWDVAFATDNFDVNVQANNGAGVKVYTYPNGDLNAWNSIDTNGLYQWTPMYNSIEDLNNGAFLRNAVPNDDFDYGWGTYDMTTHHITGDSLFIIKTVDGNFKKFQIIERNPLPAANTWEIRYADLDGANEQNVTLNAGDHSDQNLFHYSIENNVVVRKEPPSSNWDLLFTKYYDYTIPYEVSGVLINSKRVSVQQVDEVDQGSYTYFIENDFDKNYSEIGSDWKEYDFNAGLYAVAENRVYFAKVLNETKSDSTYWKLYFTAFSGFEEGKYTFIQEDVTEYSAIQEINGLELFEIYPNPANNYIRLITDANKGLEYIVTDISGKQIINGNLEKGFNQQSINISELKSGVYHISLISKAGVSSQTFIKQ